MIFKLYTSGYFYLDENDRKHLEKYGFVFEPSDYKEFHKKDDQNITIEINTLEELLAFAKEFNNNIIINCDEPSLEIYDDYRE